MTLGSLIYYSQTLLYYIALDNTKDYTRIASIFVFPIVSDWTNVFIVTWLSYAEEELTYSLAFAPDWLTKR